ncbi:MAG: type II toxin-antitoxin system MqsA family antitoxin [Epsilonproteobacteria bacterium]|jgi:YgiT-type zinc finger domain-containing protein|nr:type II toxin-antitoxin system MqsA family antitoxin [Campylobacterota bacterium]
MKCVICKHGETQQGFTTVTLEKNGATIIFKHVPAHVCDNCGEKYVDGEVTAEVLKKAQEIVSNGVQIDIREYQSAA